jgi:hypothetical protein
MRLRLPTHRRMRHHHVVEENGLPSVLWVEAEEDCLELRSLPGNAARMRLCNDRSERRLSGPTIRELLPEFVHRYRELGQFWPFIQRKFPSYAARRDFIWEEFRRAIRQPRQTPLGDRRRIPRDSTRISQNESGGGAHPPRRSFSTPSLGTGTRPSCGWTPCTSSAP